MCYSRDIHVPPQYSPSSELVNDYLENRTGKRTFRPERVTLAVVCGVVLSWAVGEGSVITGGIDTEFNINIRTEHEVGYTY